MKVRELLKMLEGVDGERLVVLQKDSEGNGYSPLYDVDYESSYIHDSREVRYEKLTPELKKLGYTEEDVDTANEGVAAIVLQPLN